MLLSSLQDAAMQISGAGLDWYNHILVTGQDISPVSGRGEELYSGCGNSVEPLFISLRQKERENSSSFCDFFCKLSCMESSFQDSHITPASSI